MKVGGDTPVPPAVDAALNKWVQLRGSGTLGPAERSSISLAVRTHGEKPPGPLYRGASLDLPASTFKPGKPIDFGPSSTSEDIGSAYPYAENGEHMPVIFEFSGVNKALNVQDRAEQQAGFGEQEWITDGRFYVQKVERDGDGNLVVTVTPGLGSSPAEQRLGVGDPVRMDELTAPVVPPEPANTPNAVRVPASSIEVGDRVGTNNKTRVSKKHVTSNGRIHVQLLTQGSNAPSSAVWDPNEQVLIHHSSGSLNKPPS